MNSEFSSILKLLTGKFVKLIYSVIYKFWIFFYFKTNNKKFFTSFMKLTMLLQDVVPWLSDWALNSQSYGSGFEPHQGSGTFVSLGKILNMQLPHSTQVYKWVPVWACVKSSAKVLMPARIHMDNHRTGKLVVKSAEYGLP